MTEPPDLRELVGDDVPEQELARLRQVDALLRATPSPPVVTDALTVRVRAIPEEQRGGSWRRRRLLAGLAAAAVIAGAAFGVGFWVGDSGGPPVAEVITLDPTPAAPAGARMVIEALPRDDAGNWRLRAAVEGLPRLPAGGYYEVWMTHGGKPVASCGRFVVAQDGSAENVWLNAPYPLEGYERWVVIGFHPNGKQSPWLLDGPVATPA